MFIPVIVHFIKRERKSLMPNDLHVGTNNTRQKTKQFKKLKNKTKQGIL